MAKKVSATKRNARLTSKPAKKVTNHPPKSNEKKSDESCLKKEIHHQQVILDIFSNAFAEVLSLENFDEILHHVKAALFGRDFERAFGNENHLAVYAARWSPTRALCYAAVLWGIHTQLNQLVTSTGGYDSSSPDEARGEREGNARRSGPLSGRRCLKLLCLGGAAAEMVAVASYLKQTASSPENRLTCIDLTLVDSAAWGPVIAKLQAGLITAPQISKYANATARASNAPFLGPEFSQQQGPPFQATFLQRDLLASSEDTTAAHRLSHIISGSSAPPSPSSTQAPILVTLFFTLNELFTMGGVGKTAEFLLNLTDHIPPSSLLLVVDSPGSYSETTVGGAERRYPMHWLLDKILLGQDEDGNKAGKDEEKEEEGLGLGVASCRVYWNKIVSHESVWFRVAERLRYPIALENMRYQMHLYRAETAAARHA